MLTLDYCLNCQRAVQSGRWSVYALTNTLSLFRCPYCRTAYTMIVGQALFVQAPDGLGDVSPLEYPG
jgi:DNA-directed RNA polymerase subunit RPC12/RpoP